jgi:hypothetical protein
MKNSWRAFFRRFAAICVAGAASAWTSAVCYAQLASDSAMDSVYADGWQEGDNGGSGFEPWNFDGSYTGAIHEIDSTSQFNNLGTAWRMAFTAGGLPRAGRGFEPLVAGQTLRMVIDNPTRRVFFKGYTVRFTAGGSNLCYGGMPCTPGAMPKERMAVYVFEYGTSGAWLTSDLADDNFQTPLNDLDTALAGMQIDFTITGPETYELVMDPLGTADTYTQSGSLSNTGAGPIDWLEFEFYNSPTNPAQATDFYIKSIEILGDAPGVAGDYNSNGVVDAADYVVWRKNLGQSFELPNEVPGVTPGMVTTHDYAEWRARFGATSSSGSAASLTAVPEPGTMVSLMGGFVLIVAVTRRRLVYRSGACLAMVALVCGCREESVPPSPPTQLQPAIRALPVEMQIKQRSTTPVPGSDESLRITIDDITAGQVMVSLADKDGRGVLVSTSLKEGEAAEFEFQQQRFELTLRELDNELVGEDFATVVVSQGLTPSPALPPRGRESQEHAARGRELEEREKIERLLKAVESAEGVVFIRNGAEHSAKDAAAHLRTKWSAAGGEIKTADDFIEKIASKSSLSGEPYRVRLADAKEVLAGEFLREKLSQIEDVLVQAPER